MLAKRERVDHSTVMQRVIPCFLSLFSKVQERRALVLIIGATNRPENIDPAFLRPGRFDRVCYVGPPDVEARVELLRLKLANRPLDASLQSDATLRRLAVQLEGWTGADIEALIDQVASYVFQDFLRNNPQVGEVEDFRDEDLRPITLGDVETAISEKWVTPSLSRAQVEAIQNRVQANGGIL